VKFVWTVVTPLNEPPVSQIDRVRGSKGADVGQAADRVIAEERPFMAQLTPSAEGCFLVLPVRS
jgi:hypothetical protein